MTRGRAVVLESECRCNGAPRPTCPDHFMAAQVLARWGLGLLGGPEAPPSEPAHKSVPPPVRCLKCGAALPNHYGECPFRFAHDRP